MKFWAFAFDVVVALEPVEDSLTVIVTMSPTFVALISAKSEPLDGAQRGTGRRKGCGLRPGIR